VESETYADKEGEIEPVRGKVLWWTLIIIWCAMIFYQSSRPAPKSDMQSLYIVTLINRMASTIIGKEVVIVTNHLVRKAAHFTEYLILGLLLFNGFVSKRALARAFFLALAAGVCYAVSDEIHQLFVPGRTGKVTDVLIDGTGILFGAGALSIKALLKIRRLS
jgi:VanZ family protein